MIDNLETWMIFVIGLCLGIFCGCVWTGIASYIDWRRNNREDKERVFYHLSDCLFVNYSKKTYLDEIVLPEV